MIMKLTDRFILVLDVETANSLDDALVYDIGWRIIDLFGKVYAEGSFVIRDIFVYEREIVKEAYYADKIPEYVADIQQGKREMVNFMEARRRILNIMKRSVLTVILSRRIMRTLTGTHLTKLSVS